MNQGKYVFAQLIEFSSHNDFIGCVAKYQGNHRVKTFTCWHQLLYMVFGQLANRESLSDLIFCLQSQQNKSYHLGMGTGTSKSNLANANEKRDYRIYESFAAILVGHAQRLAMGSSTFELPITAPVYAIDATVVDLCLNVFWWAKFRQRKGAVKLHTMLDIKTNIPTFIYITEGSVHDVNALDVFPLETGSYYVMDKGYIDFKRLYRIHHACAYFVTRAKDNFKFVRISSSKVDKSTGMKCDQNVRLKNHLVALSYPELIRRIKYYDTETGVEFVFMTNNFELSPLEIA
ncbi:transposase, IS4 family [Chitinophaga costaii]|uniref:Transposase, IS4 family n=1 Tax=Chitinophaga costaii TaxID=1335309 RepID=A0A1C4G9X9_9BACT|nr:transposase, IS4 family [Chitinophaga costaii]